MKSGIRFGLSLGFSLFLLAGCGGEKSATPPPENATPKANVSPAQTAAPVDAITSAQASGESIAAGNSGPHEHRPPHGGTPLALGQEEYHLELVPDFAKGKLAAYVLDGELDRFIRVAAPSFLITAVVEGRDEVLTFEPVASKATGETVGDTSKFEASIPWLTAETIFDGTLEELTVRATKYSRVSFKFPKGNDPDAKPAK